MRLLDAAKIEYKTAQYKYDENDLSGLKAAAALGFEAKRLFKTLVARGDKNGIGVFCIPVDRELDLKKAAIVSKNKKVEMVHVKELLSLTGYIRGGCSPIGMKKKYPTYIDSSAEEFDNIGVSAGARGVQIIINPKDLALYTAAVFCDLTVNELGDY